MQCFFKNSSREFHCAKRRLFKLKKIYVFLFKCFFYICCSTVQLLKSNWSGASVKGSIEETLQTNLGERQTSRRSLEFKRVTTAKGGEYELLVISYFF
jgi:hypothetical protein